MKRTLLLSAVIMIALAGIVYADPGNVSTSETSILNIGQRGVDTASTVTADPGNVTRINVTDETNTRFWQGYFGFASLVIELRDGTDQFYNWTNNDPSGELYFARTAISNWATVGEADDAEVYEDQFTNGYANDSSSVENLTSTYSDATSHESFQVGSTTVAAGATPSVHIDAFESVFLWDATNLQGVYTALLNASGTGYDGSTFDYQIIVPVYQDESNEAYYVYAELG